MDSHHIECIPAKKIENLGEGGSQQIIYHSLQVVLQLINPAGKETSYGEYVLGRYLLEL